MGESLEGGLAREVVFFVDRTFGGKILPARMRERGLRVRVHDDYLGQVGVSDGDWMALCNEHGWVALTEDKAIEKDPAQCYLVKRHRLKLFAFKTAEKKAEEVAGIVTRSIPKIVEIVNAYDGPLIAGIYGAWPWAKVLRVFKTTKRVDSR